jgi:hypothetical protein
VVNLQSEGIQDESEMENDAENLPGIKPLKRDCSQSFEQFSTSASLEVSSEVFFCAF